MSGVHDVVDVTEWAEGSPEPMGRSGKVWLVAPDDEVWLFKPIDMQKHRDGTKFPKGTDWSERIACETAGLLGVPAARVEFAHRRGEVGIVSRKVHPSWDLAHGNEFLVDGADYTLQAVLDCLHQWAVGPPVGTGDGPDSAGGWFAGFFVLDAIIGNTDRHQENWGVLIVPDEEPARRLAPSYDHASSLGFQISDAERMERLESRDQGRSVEAFARRGRSRPFSGRPFLTELAVAACRCTNSVEHWRQAVGKIPPDELASVIVDVPDGRMSQAARKFATELLQTNQRRLVDALAEH